MINYKHDKDSAASYYGDPKNERFYEKQDAPNPNGRLSSVDADWLNSVNTELKELIKALGLTLGTDPFEGQLAKVFKPFFGREQALVGSIVSLAYEPQANDDGSFPIDGYLPCDGSAVSRDTYANLFAVIGEKYGKGDGLSTFQMPDFRGMFLRGHDGAGGFSGGWGKKQMDAMQDHFHDILLDIQNNGQMYKGLSPIKEYGAGSTSVKVYLSLPLRVMEKNITYANIANETRPMNYCVFYCIKY